MKKGQGTRPLWFTVAASLTPGVGIVVLGLVLLAVKERDLRQEVAVEVRTAAEDAVRQVERTLVEHEAALATRLATTVADWSVQDGVAVLDLVRADPAVRWAVAGVAPVTRALPEGEASAGFLDLGGFVKDIERLEFVDGDPAAAAARYRDLALNPSCGPADRVRFQFAEAGALRRSGSEVASLEVLRRVAEGAPPDAAIDGIPVRLAATLQWLELRAAGGEDVGREARELWAGLQEGEIALPAGEAASHLRDTRQRLEAWLPAADATEREAIATLARLEALAATVDLDAGATSRGAEVGPVASPAKPTGDSGSGVLLAAVSDDGRRAALVHLADAALLDATIGDEVPVKLVAQDTTQRTDGDSLQALPGLEPLAVRASTPPDRLATLLRPWRLSVFAGLLMVVLMSAVSAVLAHRAVARRLELAQMRSDLVASISHELRTPLTAILLNLELLEDPRTDDEFRRRNARRARLSAERLKRLVDRVLQFTRADHDIAPTGAAAPVDPRELLQTAAEEMHEALGPIEVDVEADDDLPHAVLDPDAAVQVLTGLLENAAKYGGNGCHVTLRARRGDGARLRLEVEDDGPGVPADEREHLFEAFYRGPRNAGEERGVGLGLAIARRVIEAQGGTIHAEPARPGAPREGLRIVLEVPAVMAPAKETQR